MFSSQRRNVHNQPKGIYSLLDYLSVSLVYFIRIEKTDHYTEHHEHDVPWHEVIELIVSTKNPRKKGDKFQIEKGGYYLLFEIKGKTVYVINAKRT